MFLPVAIIFTVLTGGPAAGLTHQDRAELRVEVRHEAAAVPGAVVTAGAASATTDAAGVAILTVAPGPLTVTVTKTGLLPGTAAATAAAGGQARLTIALEEAPAVDEEVVVVASTRTDKRLEDQPLRVEVVPSDEVQEKIMMAPGDVSMLLNETNGLRVQTTSPSLGGANVDPISTGMAGRICRAISGWWCGRGCSGTTGGDARSWPRWG